MNMTRTFLMAFAVMVLSAGCASDRSQLTNPRHLRPLSHKLSVTAPLGDEATDQKLERLKLVIAEDIEMNTSSN
ncbi:hypothetical protein [Undibacterium sp.]|uniref:hypothetical protein n=1 Tax=Undibacterium sp. TaxID=1914977 RepID=UPI0025F0C975|nr:hypothetical protein [Undibacterium sp.]